MKTREQKPTVVIYLLGGKKVDLCGQHESVLQMALENGVSLNHACGGMGTCGTCRIKVLSDLEQLPPRNEVEQDMAYDRGFSEKERLACQMEPFEGLICQAYDDDEG